MSATDRGLRQFGVWAFVGGVLLALLIVLLWASDAIGNARQQVRTMTTKISDVPVYPGATVMKVEDESPGQGSYMQYETEDNLQAVIALYKTQLPQSDWVFDWQNEISGKQDTVNLNWRDPKYARWALGFHYLDETSTSPFDLSLLIQISEVPGASAGTKVTQVEMGLYRVPIVDRVPLPPNAAVTDTRDEMVGTYQNLSQIMEHNTTFTTNLSPDDVRAYYRDTLEQHGWVLIGPALEPITDKQIPGSLHFTWWQGGIETGVLSASVGVIIKSQSDHQTVVELRTSGETGLR
jgi:hypothetical protein